VYRTDLQVALLAAAVGLVLDTLVIRPGLLRYAVSLPWQGFAPFWILVM
jgi:hypothetical protein